MNKLSLALFACLVACSGQRQVFRVPPDLGLGIEDAGLIPAVPAPFERATAWALVRDAARVEIFVASIPTHRADEPGFELVAEDFLAHPLQREASGKRGSETWSTTLPPRQPDQILFWYFVADDGTEQSLFPSDAPGGAVPVAGQSFDLDFAWPRIPEPVLPIACNFDRSLYDADFTVPGLPFEEIDAPIWKREAQATILGNSAGVRDGIGIEIDGQAWFFPLAIMLWQEVANESFEGRGSVMSYCPLTDTAVHFRHDNSGRQDRFWDVGGLYNNNLVVSDPRTPQSKVPQMLAIGLDGALDGSCVEVAPSFLCSWNFWKRFHPDSQILNGDRDITEIDWIARDNPYRNYWVDGSDIRFPIKHSDEAHPMGLHNKNRVLGILAGTGNPIALPLDVAGEDENFVYNLRDPERPYLAIWMSGAGYAAAFERIAGPDEALLEFRFANASYEGVRLLEDDSPEPSLWTPLGVAISGPRQGQRLAWVPSMRAFWFAWYAMYPHGELLDPRVAVEP